MKYRTADLDYIFVRIGAKDKTLNEMTDTEFLDWVRGRFNIEVKDDKDAQGTPWIPEQKVALLNEMAKRAKGPVVVMIARERRDEWNKKSKANGNLE